MKKIYSVLVLFFFFMAAYGQGIESLNLDTLYDRYEKMNENHKFIVIDYWATWCKPCIVSLPHVNDIIKNNKLDEFTFLSVTVDSPEVIDRFLQKNVILGNIGIDYDFSSLKSFGYQLIPQMIIIDIEGNVIWEGRPIELTPKLLSIIANNEEVPERIPNNTYFTLDGPVRQGISEISLSSGHKFEFTRQTIDNIYRNILGWLNEKSIEVEFIGFPKQGYDYNCTCSADTFNYSNEQFLRFCLNSLNGALGSTVIEEIEYMETLNIESVDSTILLKSSSQGTPFSSLTDEHIILENFGLRTIIQSVAYVYDLKYNVDRSIYENYRDRLFTLKLNRVKPEDLEDELQKTGLNAVFKETPEKFYKVVY